MRAHLSDTEGELATEGAKSELEAATTSAHLTQPGGEIEVSAIADDEDDEPVPLT